MACKNMGTCPLFPLFRLKENLKVWQTRFCEGDYERCERYRASAAGKPVPGNLLPNGVLLTVKSPSTDAK